MAKKTDTAVESTEETAAAPTKSLFAGAKDAPVKAEEVAEETDTSETEDATEEASETTEEATADDEVSIEELKRQADEVNAKLKARQDAEKDGILAQVVQVVSEYGITVEEVVNALGGMKSVRKGVPAKAKYRDPATGAEWSGRGKPPLWIKDKDRAQYLIEQPAA